MSEAPDKESKTEEATERRIRDTVEKGNVPVSREAPIFASMLGILAIAAFFMADRSARLALALQQLIDDPGGWALENGTDATRLFAMVGGEAVRFLVPVIATLTVAGLVASFLQNAPRVVLERIRPQASRISIRQGARRVFGVQGQTEFLKSTLKFAAVTLVVLVILHSDQMRVVNAMFADPAALPELILALAMKLLAAVSVGTIVLVAADLVWARVHWRRDLRMTRQEVKDEIKQVEGDPLVRARLRSLARDRARRRMIAAVPRATLVIANPTHYAIALRYVREEGGAPVTLAKGQDLIALKIKEVAAENNIPIVEDKALARSMFDVVEVDRMIPPEFYRAVAEIIFFLQSRGAARIGAR
jgi:flagellar biosynthetic protein FlhB